MSTQDVLSSTYRGTLAQTEKNIGDSANGTAERFICRLLARRVYGHLAVCGWSNCR